MLPVLVLSLIVGAGAQNPPDESRVRIGILDLAVSGGDEKLKTTATDLLATSVGEVGFYAIHRQDDLKKAFSEIGKTFPKSCRDLTASWQRKIGLPMYP